MQIPLRNSVLKVIKIIEKLNLSDCTITNEYLNGLGSFISNMLQWEHNEDLKHDYFDRLATISIQIISSREVNCAFYYGKILFWLDGCDRQRFQQYFLASSESSYRVLPFLQNAQIDEEWRNRTRNGWDNFLNRFVILSNKYREEKISSTNNEVNPNTDSLNITSTDEEKKIEV